MYLIMHYLGAHWYDPVQDAGMSATKASFWKEYDATQQLWTNRYKWYIPFYLPWMSLIYRAWLRVMKMKYTFAESIVITFFSSSQMTIPQIFVLVVAWAFNNTAFTRTSDQVLNRSIITLTYFFRFYQLGNPALKKSWRLTLSLAGAILMMGFALTAIFAFLWLANKIGF